MSNLSAPISREPWLDQRTGQVSRFWQQFLVDLFLRVGGETAPTNTDLSIDMPEDSGLEELREYVFRLERSLSSAPPVFEAARENDTSPPVQQITQEQYLETQVRALAEELAALRAEISALNQEPPA